MGVDSPILEEQKTQPGKRQTSHQFLLIVPIIVVCLVAGACSWLIEKPGEGLLWPIALDVIILAFLGALYRFVSALPGHSVRTYWALLNLSGTWRRKCFVDVFRCAASKRGLQFGRRECRSS